MVQRKVLSKIGIQANLVTCDKSMENKGSDMKKKMKKSRLIKLSNVEALHFPSSHHVPTTAASIQKHNKPMVGTRTDNSPNYMRPTRSSDAKKEIFPVSFRNTKSRKNLQQKCSVSSKASLVSYKKPAKSLTRSSSSLNFGRTLTKGPSFKPSRTCTRKSTATPVRQTCSSTLKDSKFPEYLMLNHGGTESERTSVINVCPYRYCSLNGHHHAPLPPLKSFVSAKRRILKTQRSMKLEPMSPLRLKMPCDIKNIDIEKNVLEKAHDEADRDDPIIIPLAKEIGENFFIEIYVKGNAGEDDLGKFESAKDFEDQDNIEFADDENGIAAEEDGVKETDMESEEQFCSFDNDGNIDSSVFTEDTNSNFEFLLDSSHDVSLMFSGDTYSSHQADILVEEAFKEADGEEYTCYEAQPQGTDSVLEGASESKEFETQEIDYLSNNTSFDQSTSTEEVLEHLISTEDNNGETEKHVDNEAGCTKTKVENSIHSFDRDQGRASKIRRTGCEGCDYQKSTSKSWQRTTKRKRPAQDDEEMRWINLRKPRFLPLYPESEPEKANLKHQMMDERKNAEEWMLDFALRQAVTQLGPARKKKVAMLVEAFETVMPITKCESHMRSNSPFAIERPIQACN